LSLHDELTKYGWDADLQRASQTFDETTEPARVAAADRGSVLLFSRSGERRGVRRKDVEDIAAGDWVMIERRPSEEIAPVVAVLPRRSKLARKVAGKRTAEHTIVSNVDTIFVVTGLGNDFNVRRIERYLALAWAGGAQPVLVLTKADLCEDVPAALAEASAVAVGVRTHAVSSVTGEGLEELGEYLVPGRTVAAVGSSGAGKSTLINALCGADLQKVQELGWYGKGRHTTTRRELVVAPNGVLFVDTPGLREVGLWQADEGVAAAFSDVEELAQACRFNDCRHQGEPGCAVAGRISNERLGSYRKLQREAQAVAARADKAAQAAQRRERRKFARSLKKDAY
jgi:ribosome biogenesis GTPase / thiamine phosphate phosphatase